MKRFTVRTILVAMLIVAVGLALHRSMRGQPRPFVSMDSIIKSRAGEQALNGARWEIHTPPDVEGPYRTVGDDWTGSSPQQANPGQSFRAWIDLKSGRRFYDLPAVPGNSYLIIPLENRKSERTMLIMSRMDQTRTTE